MHGMMSNRSYRPGNNGYSGISVAPLKDIAKI